MSRLDRADWTAWIVLNQSQSAAFQGLIEQLALRLGPCVLMTGSPFPVKSDVIDVVPAPAYNRAGLASRVLSWIRYLAFVARRTSQERGRPFLLVTTNPPFLPQLALALNRLKGWSFGVLIWDIYPEHLVRSGILGDRNLAVRSWHRLNRAALERASLVVTLSDRMAETIALRAPKIRAQIAVIPNFADTEKIQPLPKDKNPFAAEHDLVGKTVVLYSGNMGATHGLDGVVAAAGMLRDRNDISFVFIGDGLGKNALVEHSNQLGLKNVTFLPMQPEERLPHSLTVGDIALVAQAPGSEHLSLPSKTYSFMAAGCAILAITDEQSDLASLVTKYAIGEVTNGDPATIASCLTRLIGNAQRLAEMRRKSRELAVTAFDVGVVERRWGDLLHSLIPQIGGDADDLQCRGSTIGGKTDPSLPSWQ